ncbi:MAG: prepilin peptidase [Acidimicrobiia bacterium]|nr:prepilin peptidase [Acidimicrobiia bacterium]
MSALLVGACALAGALLAPAEAAASRVLHERPPRGDELLAGFRPRDRRLLLCGLASAALFALTAATWGWSWALVPHLFLIAVLVVMAAVDFEHYLIPNRLVFPSLGVSAALLVLASALDGSPERLGPAALGAVAYYVGLFLTHLVNPAGMGFGDVKLALLLGLFLGWSAQGYVDSLYLVLLALLVGSALGSVVGVVLLVRRGRGAHYPFGPWLALGTVVVLVGAELLRSS